MTPVDEFLIRLPVYSILIYIPFVCWLDVKKREIEHAYWLPLWIVNLPAMIYLYRTGVYPLEALPISLIMVGIFFMLNAVHFIEGADMLWLWAISLFFVINPWPVPHGIMQFSFYAMLIAVMTVTAAVLLVLNYRKGYRDSLYQMMSRWERGVPFVLPISAAFILAVMWG